ncbi:hypothetical protein CHS0354_038635 [Potamilus streckersoni]|uniref:Uncharacterized protein n=1 Tax=Potamilus streckersoni TaxID=2493646 RepID=A0AAE0T7G4_9BIVA|nr:hypothetical protein CHS0354_038635 [Potamilus streckersoni]
MKTNIKLKISTFVPLVAPDSRCKPKIIRGVDTLIATPVADHCGIPLASAYRLQKPSITAEQNMIKLLPGQGVGTVYACIDSPAISCAKNSKLSDYCTVFEDDSK